MTATHYWRIDYILIFYYLAWSDQAAKNSLVFGRQSWQLLYSAYCRQHSVQHSVSALPSKWHQKHTYTHTKNIIAQATDYKCFIFTTSIENPRVGGSIPPLGTTFTNKNNGLAKRNAR